MSLFTTHSGKREASESSVDCGDAFEAGIARLIEEDQREEVNLPDDSMAYFARRLAWLSTRQTQLDVEFPEGPCAAPAGDSEVTKAA